MNKTLNYIYIGGYLLLIIATVLHILQINFSVYIFTAAVVLVVVSRIFLLPRSTDFRVKRLNLIQGFNSFLLVASAYFMFKHSNSWAVTLLLAAFIDFYTSFRYPKTE